MTSGDFRIVVQTPQAATDPSLAIAAARAGHIGILGLPRAAGSPACDSVDRLCAGARGAFGLAVVDLREESVALLVDAAARGAGWAVVSADAALADPPVLKRLGKVGLRVLIETTDWHPGLARLAPCDGIIVKGHEAGGPVGEQTGFILVQKLLAQSGAPVYVRGGIGLHSVAAIRAAGASGVVLDDQLLMLPEANLRDRLEEPLSRFTGIETSLVDLGDDRRLRLFERPGSRAAKALQDQISGAGLLEAEADAAVENATGWNIAGGDLAPMGQAACFASDLAARFGSVGRVARAFLRASEAPLSTAVDRRVLGAGTGVAETHGTEYPIVQGPMTRVSDTGAFAQAVSEGGALPMVALALMRPDKVEELLADVEVRLAGKAWGVGLLGFAPSHLIRQQVEVAKRHGPTFALIAGGRPDQARDLEAEGIPSYLHVPSPRLLTMFLEQGAKRFVFEGRECGGHIGPLSSLVLWDQMVGTLLKNVTDEAEARDIHVLFAGGIHDARSAAAVAALAAPLAERGIRVGVLLGTAYLFCEEAVEAGSIVPEFQKVALACDRTVALETGPGHASRAAISPFTEEFFTTRRTLEDDGRSGDEIREELEGLSLGRLRIATKATMRDGDALKKVPLAKQRKTGMYMIGQAAALRHETTTIRRLHSDISAGAQALLADAARAAVPAAAKAPEPRPADIAIVGISAYVPGAESAGELWENILDSKIAIGEIPKSRWDWRLYFDEDRGAKDRIYSKWGGFLPDMPFDPFTYGIPPRAISAVDPLQLMTLEVGRRCLEDAGYNDRSLPRDRASVILGASGGTGDVGAQYAVRAELTRFSGGIDPVAEDLLPSWTEDSFAGILLNVAAGRAANRFDFGGVNYTVDAACASSLSAVYQAVLELETGRSDIVLAGGIDTVQGPFGYLCFSKTQALSPNGRCASFQADANGIVISEGIAMVALKRLADAERDGDRIYAVIKGVGGSSDGRAKSMTAPHPDGQIRALSRAYDMAGYSPATVGLFEAHGTGTVAGDTAELETVTRLLESAGAGPRHAAVGSIKTMIGHTKATAGIAGMIKASLACYHGVLPPHGRLGPPNARLADETSPLFLVDDPLPWPGTQEAPRRAGVSSFGFGGTNFHVTLEEYDGNRAIPALAPAPRRTWPHELLVWRAADRAALAGTVRALAGAVSGGPAPDLRDLAFTLARKMPKTGLTAALVVSDPEKAGAEVAALAAHLEDPASPLPTAAAFRDAPLLAGDGKLALIFPGQGTQYPGMLQDILTLFPPAAEVLGRADNVLADRMAAKGLPDGKLSRAILPAGAYDAPALQAAADRLTRTDIAQPALGAIEAGLLQVLTKLGVAADMAAGHSYGEFVALHAAEVFDFDDLLRVSEARGRFMVEAAEGGDLGTMGAVMATRDAVEAAIEGIVDLCVANHNTPGQTILSGSTEAVKAGLARCEALGMTTKPIPVGAAFHSPIVAPARDHLAAFLTDMPFASPSFPVFANSTGDPYPDAPDGIRGVLAEQLAKPVEFVTQIERMHDHGARVFLNVGPKATHSAMVAQILGDRDHRSIAIDDGEGGLEGLLHALASLLAEGADLRLAPLFAGRDARIVDLRSPGGDGTASLASHIWLLNGSGARKVGDPPLRVLTLEEADRLRAERARPVDDSDRPAAAHSDPVSVPAQPPPGHGARQTSAPGHSHFDRRTKPMDDHDPYGAPNGAAEHAPNGYPAGNGQLSDLTAFQATMTRFLETQESVMLAYLGAGNGARPVRQVRRPPPVLAQRSMAALSAPPPVPPQPPAAAPILAAAPAARSNGGKAHPAPHGYQNGAASQMPVNGAAHASAPAAPPAPAPTVPDPAPEPAAAAAPSSPSLNESALKDMVLGLFEDRTGYPRDMLGMEQNIEADLGIDSIKKVEIVGALLKSLPGDAKSAASDMGETLNREKTLAGIVSTLWGRIGSAAEVVAPRPFDLAGAEQAVMDRPPRFLTKEEQRCLPLEGAVPLGRYLITDDCGGIAEAVAEALARAGATAEIVAAEALATEAGAAATVRPDAPLAGFVHLAPAGAAPVETPEAWQAQIERNELAPYLALQAHAAALATGRIVLVTRLDGRFGRGGALQPGLHALGGGTGLAKSLREEWPECRANAIDLDPATTAAEAAAHLVAELAAPNGRIEVGYPAGTRAIFRTVPAKLPGETLATVGPDWVILATGGARGITAEVLRPLAARGATLLLLGRSPLPEPEPQEIAALSTTVALRTHFVQSAKAAGERLTPAQIGRQIDAVLRDREIRANLADFEFAGARVHYIPVDVSDPATLRAAVEAAYAAHGRIDGVVHGAGVIEDKLLVDKTPESWRRVVGTKLSAAHTLSTVLRPDSLKFLAFFTSVAGRYGNSGQTDYAIANEVMNRLAWQLHGHWGDRVKVMALNWGPWDRTRHGAGMVSEEARRKFEDMKVLLVDPDGGAAAFIDEIERGPRCDVEIVLGAGPWEQREEYVAGEGRTEVPATAYAAPRPLLHGAEPGMGRAGATRLAWTLSLGDDPWLAEHRIAGVPVLPSACALEIMARGLAEIWPDWTLNEISAHRLLAGLKLEDDAPGDVELLLTGGEHSDIDGFGARAELRSAGKTPRVLYRSNGVFAAATPEARAAPPMPELPASPVTAAQAYREILSHGPRYQLVTEITGLGPAGMTARVRPSVPDAFGAGTALFDPGLVDVAAQMVWVWTNRTRGAAALPNGIARVARHAGGPATSMQLRILPETDESRIFADVAFLDAAGRAVLDLQQMECTYNPALERICGYDGEVIV